MIPNKRAIDVYPERSGRCCLGRLLDVRAAQVARQRLHEKMCDTHAHARLTFASIGPRTRHSHSPLTLVTTRAGSRCRHRGHVTLRVSKPPTHQNLHDPYLKHLKASASSINPLLLFLFLGSFSSDHWTSRSSVPVPARIPASTRSRIRSVRRRNRASKIA